MPSDHALLSASSSARWLSCPPSALLAAQYPDTASEAAEEGTVAHALAEAHLRQLLRGEPLSAPPEVAASPYYRPSMEDYVAVYTDYVMGLYREVQQTSADAELRIEQRVDFSRYVPGGFGTADAVIVADDILHVIDLKYGKGVPVEAAGNPQIRLYGVGTALDVEMLYRVTRICLHIVQPRLDSNTTEEIGWGALSVWARDYVRPVAAMAAQGKGDRKAGAWCRFCPAKNTCRAYAEDKLALARIEFAEPDHIKRLPDELSMEEIGQILERVDDLAQWAKGIKAWALDRALAGEPPVGWKAVAGRAVRRIADETAAAKALLDSGYRPDQVMELRGLTALEELAGKKKLAELIGEYIVKPQGKPALVRDTDKRPALTAAAQDFNDDYFEEV